MKKRKFTTNFDSFISTPIAHRGLHGGSVTENSIQSFVAAIQQNYAIEIDIHLTADNIPVVIHDSNTKRLLSVVNRVEKMTLEQLKALSLKDGSKVPTLEETLKLIDGKVPLLIEFKVYEKNFAELVDGAVKLLEGYDTSTVAFQSFFPACIKYAIKKYPQYACGQLTSGEISGHGKLVSKIFKTLLVLKFSHADFVSYDIEYLPNKYVERYRKKGGKVLCWLVDSDEKKQIALQSADNIIFEIKT